MFRIMCKVWIIRPLSWQQPQVYIPTVIILLRLLIIPTSADNQTNYFPDDFVIPPGGFQDAPIICIGDSSLSAVTGFLSLTPEPHDGRVANSSGRCLVDEPISLWKIAENGSRVLSSFNTSFTFRIAPAETECSLQQTDGDDHDITGDGIAFIIVPDNSFVGSSGGYLGLLNEETNGKSSSNTFALEFDTFQNREAPFNDPDYHTDDDGSWNADLIPYKNLRRPTNVDHIGIDLNSMNSVYTIPAYYNKECTDHAGDLSFEQVNVVLGSGLVMQAWIDYSADTGNLEVYITADQLGLKPSHASFSHPVNLSGIIQENMYIGFSSATGSGSSRTTVQAWSFTTSSSTTPRFIFNNTSYSMYSCSNNDLMELKFLNTKLLLLTGTIASFAVVLLMGGVTVIWYMFHFKKSLYSKFNLTGLQYLDPGPQKFTYEELSTATNDFSPKLVLGRDVFGSVYRGNLKGSQQLIAVKRIPQDTQEGVREFIDEVKIIGSLRHRNLVQLLGWCHERGELLLVYEYMPNGSLDQLIFKEEFVFKDDSFVLRWEQRLKILIEVATALLYLHEEWEKCVVHRDVKPSNVMLDATFQAKLGNFGLARLYDHCTKLERSDPINSVMDHESPVYLASGSTAIKNQCSEKTDVDSYGGLALEIACGRRSVDVSKLPHEVLLVDWVWNLYTEDLILEAADFRLMGRFNPQEMRRLLMLGLACSHPNAGARPTMRQVLRVLKGEAPPPALPRSQPLPMTTPDHHTCDDDKSTSLVTGFPQSEETSVDNIGNHSFRVQIADHHGLFGSLQPSRSSPSDRHCTCSKCQLAW